MFAFFAELQRFSLIYLADRFLYRLFAFLRHWYLDAFFNYAEFIVKFLAKIDRLFAVRINFYHLFHPLYQDYTILGYILGFIFRSGRIIIGSIIYIFLIVLAILLYLIWAIIPLWIVWKGMGL